MSLFQRSKNLSLWRSINRVHNNLSNHISGDSRIIIDAIRNDYSQNIHSESEVQDDIINIKETDFKKEKDFKKEEYIQNEEDIQNTGKFYKKGKMSYWCDN